MKIQFDKSAAGFILDTFKDSFPKVCFICGKKVTKKNLGGVMARGFIHDNIICLIQSYYREHKKG